MENSSEKRVTLSFYQYANIEDPNGFSDKLYESLFKLGVFGRIYVASEGVNGQISVPEKNFEIFKQELYHIHFLDGIRLNVAIEDYGKSFYKLKIKVRSKIVADGLNDSTFDASRRGKPLSAEAYNQLTDDRRQ